MSREVSQLSNAYILSKYCEAKIFNALRVDFSIKDSYDRKSLHYIVNLNPEVGITHLNKIVLHDRNCYECDEINST